MKRQTGGADAGSEEIGCCTRAAKVSLAARVGLTSFKPVSEYFLLAYTHLVSRTSGPFWENIPRLELECSDACETRRMITFLARPRLVFKFQET